jgi:hypothetical protein
MSTLKNIITIIKYVHLTIRIYIFSIDEHIAQGDNIGVQWTRGIFHVIYK